MGLRLVQKGAELMFEIFYIIFDRRHVKDPRTWVMLVLAITLGAYHRYYVKPRLDRHGEKIRLIIKAGKLEAKINALKQESPRRDDNG